MPDNKTIRQKKLDIKLQAMRDRQYEPDLGPLRGSRRGEESPTDR